MQFGVLGPVAVTTDAGDPVVVPGTKVRLLLADLLVHRNHVVSADRLIDDLWGADPPANAIGALQVRVSQLRKALGDAEPSGRDLVESVSPGYLLHSTAVDADRFASLADSADPAQLGTALDLWRGDAYADVADQEFVRTESTRLAELRVVVLERLAGLRLERGEHEQVAAQLAALVAKFPLREGLRALYLRALYAAGRQTEALDSYAELRDRLADELGLDPGPELVALQQKILAQDAELAPAPKAAQVRNSLPARLDELVGRADALAELRALVPHHRLVTLTGPGGVGKTRLATEAAREFAETPGTTLFPDGTHLVELTALPSGDTTVAVAELVLSTLGVREVAGIQVGATDRLLTALRRRELLLVLDNCEHVIEAVAELVATLLRGAPGLTVLATSREPLGTTGEWLCEVTVLTVPPVTADLDAIRRSSAARLFAARAAARQRGFRLDERTAPLVAHLCRRLDGLPLALELAATRVRTLGLAGVIERLDDRFALLSSPQRDLPPRQRTLSAVIAWSWDLLDDNERGVLARLAVFADGAALAAAEAVDGADPDILSRLVDRSLVVMDDTGSTPRYRLLESVAAFALDRSPDSLDDARARHAAYFTTFAETADVELRGPRQYAALRRLDAETANLRTALGNGGGLRLAVALSWYWFLRGRFSEARTALSGAGGAAERAAAAAWRTGFALLQGAPSAVADSSEAVAVESDSRGIWFVANGLIERSELSLAAATLERALASADTWTAAAALSSRAKIAHARGDLAALEADGNRSAAMFEELGDDWGRLQASDWVGGHAELVGDYARAVELHRAGLSWAERLGLTASVGSKLAWLAWIAVQTRDYPQAVELAERALRLAREQDSPAAQIFAELSLGIAARRIGRLEVAAEHLQRLLATARLDVQPALFLPLVLVELGYLARDHGDRAAALPLHGEAFDAAMAMGSPRDAIGALEGMASVIADDELAARLLGAARQARLLAEFAATPTEQDEIANSTTRLVTALGQPRFDELADQGRGLTPEDARGLVRLAVSR